jgi:outer membrane receptor protein involved in Fe transport
MTRLASLLALALCLPAAHAAAQDSTSPTPTPTPSDDSVKRQEVVVVTASRVEEQLADAPATMSVISSDTLLTSAAQNYGDLLRAVPGVNAIQMSARDVNITSRQATQTLSNSQLGLLDGRSIYIDLFGFIVWDFVPISPVDVKQIEVVRGPASAVWGANAFTGAINIVTKTPRESAGTTVTATGGMFSRDAGSTKGEGAGNSYGVSLSHSRAPNDKWAYRITGGYFHSDEFARPTGTVPVGVNPSFPDPTVPAAKTGGGTYPAFTNSGTNQPKVDLRVDQDLSNGARITYSGGYAGTSGMIHTGIGPFEVQDGSYMAYGRTSFNKGNLRIAAFANFLDVDAPNRILRDPATGDFVQGLFKTNTYDLEAGNSHLLGSHNILSYGGNVRRNDFDISIAPSAEDRTEYGAYVQDEVYYGKFRVTLGARLDKFSSIEDPVFSPRLSATYKPLRDHAIRVGYNRAFRAPSVINESLDIRTTQGVDLRVLSPALPFPFPLVVNIVGNDQLVEESMTAYEIAYTGTFGGKTTLGIAAYMNDLDDNINFVNLPPSTDPYTAQNPPPGFPPQLAPALALLASRGIFLPRTAATYLNLGPIRNKGVEVSLDHQFTNAVSVYANYSYQGKPKPKESDTPFPPEEISAPPKNRYNAGISAKHKKVFGSISLNHADDAFWPDVLTPEYHGFTDAYTMVNATLGLRWNEHATFSVKGTNLANDDIQQHIFGDFLKRNVVGELRVTF